LVGLVLCATACSGSARAPTQVDDTDQGPLIVGTSTRKLRVDGVERSYRVIVPPTLDLASPTRAVMVLHGNPPIDMEPVTLVGREAADRRFIAVYPTTAYTREWVHGCNCTANGLLGVNDVRYFEALLDDLEAAVSGGLEQVFVAGYSNGGMMVYRLACDLPHRFDGFAAVSSGMWTWSMERCGSPDPVELVVFNGTRDPQFPWDGMRLLVESGAEMVQASIENTVSFWAERNGCLPQPNALALPDAFDDATSVQEWRWSGCDAELVFYRVEGGGHTWPGSRVTFAPVLGRNTREIDATSLMLDRFLGS
jgi:polyhydroxybutyrate depolymerase